MGALKGAFEMKTQAVFEAISEAESLLFCCACENPTEEMKQLLKDMQKVLVKFAELTGCRNE